MRVAIVTTCAPYALCMRDRYRQNDETVTRYTRSMGAAHLGHDAVCARGKRCGLVV